MDVPENEIKMVIGSSMTIAMATVSMTIEEMLACPNLQTDLANVCTRQKADVMVVMTTNPPQNQEGEPDRSLAVFSRSRIYKDQIADCLDNEQELQLEPVEAPFDDIRIFDQGNTVASLGDVQPILQSFLNGADTPNSSREFEPQDSVSDYPQVSDSLEGSDIAFDMKKDVKFIIGSMDDTQSSQDASRGNSLIDINEEEILSVKTGSDVIQTGRDEALFNLDPLSVSSPEKPDPKDSGDVELFDPFKSIVNSSANTSLSDVMTNPNETTLVDKHGHRSQNVSSSCASSNFFDFPTSISSDLVDPFSSVEEVAPNNKTVTGEDTKVGNDEEGTEADAEGTVETEAATGNGQDVFGSTNSPFFDITVASPDAVDDTNAKKKVTNPFADTISDDFDPFSSNELTSSRESDDILDFSNKVNPFKATAGVTVTESSTQVEGAAGELVNSNNNLIDVLFDPVDVDSKFAENVDHLEGSPNAQDIWQTTPSTDSDLLSDCAPFSNHVSDTSFFDNLEAASDNTVIDPLVENQMNNNVNASENGLSNRNPFFDIEFTQSDETAANQLFDLKDNEPSETTAPIDSDLLSGSMNIQQKADVSPIIEINPFEDVTSDQGASDFNPFKSDWSNSGHTSSEKDGTDVEVDEEQKKLDRLDIEAALGRNPKTRKSISLTVEVDHSASEDDKLAELSESDFYDKIPTPEQGDSLTNSPFVNPGMTNPFEGVAMPRSSRSSGYPSISTPPNSLMDTGFQNISRDHDLPSFNSAEMVQRIHRKKASLGGGLDFAELEFDGTMTTPYTPQNSFREDSGGYMKSRSLLDFSNTNVEERVQEKRSSLGAIMYTDVGVKKPQNTAGPADTSAETDAVTDVDVAKVSEDGCNPDALFDTAAETDAVTDVDVAKVSEDGCNPDALFDTAAETDAVTDVDVAKVSEDGCNPDTLSDTAAETDAVTDVDVAKVSEFHNTECNTDKISDAAAEQTAVVAAENISEFDIFEEKFAGLIDEFTSAVETNVDGVEKGIEFENADGTNNDNEAGIEVTADNTAVSLCTDKENDAKEKVENIIDVTVVNSEPRYPSKEGGNENDKEVFVEDLIEGPKDGNGPSENNLHQKSEVADIDNIDASRTIEGSNSSLLDLSDQEQVSTSEKMDQMSGLLISSGETEQVSTSEIMEPSSEKLGSIVSHDEDKNRLTKSLISPENPSAPLESCQSGEKTTTEGDNEHQAGDISLQDLSIFEPTQSHHGSGLNNIEFPTQGENDFLNSSTWSSHGVIANANNFDISPPLESGVGNGDIPMENGVDLLSNNVLAEGSDIFSVHENKHNQEDAHTLDSKMLVDFGSDEKLVSEDNRGASLRMESDTNDEFINEDVMTEIEQTANQEVVTALAGHFVNDLISDAVDLFPDMSNAALAECVTVEILNEPDVLLSQDSVDSVCSSSSSVTGDASMSPRVTGIKPFSMKSPRTPRSPRRQPQFSVETDYLPSMDPLHGNLNIVTSPSSNTQLIETDADREVVESESFRKQSREEHLAHGQETHQDITAESEASTDNDTIEATTDLLGDIPKDPDEESTIAEAAAVTLEETHQDITAESEASTDNDIIEATTDMLGDIPKDPDEESTIAEAAAVTLEETHQDITADSEASTDNDIIEATTDLLGDIPKDPDESTIVEAAAVTLDNVTTEAPPDDPEEECNVSVATDDADEFKSPDTGLSENSVEKTDKIPEDINQAKVDVPVDFLSIEEVIGTFVETESANIANEIITEDGSVNPSAVEKDYQHPSALALETKGSVNVSDKGVSALSDESCSISPDSSSSYCTTDSESDVITVRENIATDEAGSRHQAVKFGAEILESRPAFKAEQHKPLDIEMNNENGVYAMLEGGNKTSAERTDIPDVVLTDYDTINDVSETKSTHATSSADGYVDDLLGMNTEDQATNGMIDSTCTIETISPIETPDDEHAAGFYEVNPEGKTGTEISDSQYSTSSAFETNLGENTTGFYEVNPTMSLMVESSVLSAASLSPLDTPSPNSERGFYEVNPELEEKAGEADEESEGTDVFLESNPSVNAARESDADFFGYGPFDKRINEDAFTSSGLNDLDLGSGGFSSMDAALQGSVLQNIQSGSAFSPLLSPNEEPQSFQINAMVPGLDAEQDDSSDDEDSDDSAPFKSYSLEMSPTDPKQLTENKVLDLADDLVSTAITGAIETVCEVKGAGDIEESSDSETSSTTTEGSYRISHSTEVSPVNSPIDDTYIEPVSDNVSDPLEDVQKTSVELEKEEGWKPDADHIIRSEETASDKTSVDNMQIIEMAQNLVDDVFSSINAGDIQSIADTTASDSDKTKETEEGSELPNYIDLKFDTGGETVEMVDHAAEALDTVLAENQSERNENDIAKPATDKQSSKEGTEAKIYADEVMETKVRPVEAEYEITIETDNVQVNDMPIENVENVKTEEVPLTEEIPTIQVTEAFEDKTAIQTSDGIASVPDTCTTIITDNSEVPENAEIPNTAAPSVIETEAVDKTAAVDDSSAVDSTSVVEDTAVIESTAAIKNTSAVDDTSVVEETAVIENTAAIKNTSASENTSAVDNTAAMKDTSTVDNTAAMKDTSAVDNTAAMKDTSAVDNTAAMKDTSAVDNTAASENTSVFVETSASENTAADPRTGEDPPTIPDISSTPTTLNDASEGGASADVPKQDIVVPKDQSQPPDEDFNILDHKDALDPSATATLQPSSVPRNQLAKNSPSTSKDGSQKMKEMEDTQEWHEDPIPGMGAAEGPQDEGSSESESDSDSDSELYNKPVRPGSLLDGKQRLKKIEANSAVMEDDDIETPDDMEGELEWEDETPMTPSSETKKFSEYREAEMEREQRENTQFRKVEIAGKHYRVDMHVIEPYKKVLSHGGYYGDGLNAIILFCGCYLPDRGRRDYQYVMDNLFLYVISTLELLVAEDYMIVYFHGATPRRQMPSFGWLKRCYQMIDRRLRKNLKALLMVHPTLWLKTVVMMTKPFISSKFSSKLRFVKTLQELGRIVPMEYIYVPEPVQHTERMVQTDPDYLDKLDQDTQKKGLFSSLRKRRK